MTFYNINSFNTWTWNIFPFIFVLFKFFNQHLCFQCTGLLPPWLNLFLGFYSLWCSCRWDCFLNFSDSWFLWGFFVFCIQKFFSHADDITLMAESEEELKSLLMKVKEESEKAGLKLNIQKMKIMASDPMTTWQTDGETMETVTDCMFLGSRITADGDCSHEIKRYLLLGRKAMTNLDSTLKSRDITLLTKVCLLKAVFFPVVMYGYESWTIKKAECWSDAFELWYWRRLLRVPWTSRRSNQ